MLHCMEDVEKDERNWGIANQLGEPSQSKEDLIETIVGEANQTSFHTDKIEQQWHGG